MTEKSELLVQIAKVSRQKIETTDHKIHDIQLKKTGGKRKVRNQDMFEKYKKILSNLALNGCFFQAQ